MHSSSSWIALSLGLCCLVPGCDEAGMEPSGRDAEVDAGREDAGSAVDATLDAASTDASAEDASDAAQQPDAAHDAAVKDASAPDATIACTAVAPTSCPETIPTYNVDIKPLVERRCESCHSPHWTGPWPLDAYEHVADWQEAIRLHLLDCTMPPPEGGGPLSKTESDTFLLWLRCGLPE